MKARMTQSPQPELTGNLQPGEAARQADRPHQAYVLDLWESAHYKIARSKIASQRSLGILNNTKMAARETEEMIASSRIASQQSIVVLARLSVANRARRNGGNRKPLHHTGQHDL